MSKRIASAAGSKGIGNVVYMALWIVPQTILSEYRLSWTVYFILDFYILLLLSLPKSVAEADKDKTAITDALIALRRGQPGARSRLFLVERGAANLLGVAR